MLESRRPGKLVATDAAAAPENPCTRGVTLTSPGSATSCPTDGCCSTTSRSGSARAPRSRWSAPTAPARPPCCASSPATWSPHAGAITRSRRARRHAPDGHARRRATRPRPAALRRAAAGPRRGRPVERLELRLMDTDDEKTQLRVRHGARRSGPTPAGTTSRCCGTPAAPRRWACLRQGEVPRPRHAQRRRAEAARAGGPAARARRGAAARRAGQLPRRAGQAVAGGAAPRVAQDGAVRQPRPGAAGQHRDPGGHRRARRRRGTRSGRTRAASRRTTRPGATGSRGSRSCAGAGTRSTRSSRRWC